MDAFVQLPPELKNLLLIIVTVAVTGLLKFLSAKLNFDLSGYAAQVASAIVAAILVLISAVLSNIPAQFAPIATSLLSLLVVLLGSWGAYKFGKQFRK